ncbi:hypothetical protein BJ742DRAFT_786012 [Cladochytrium replicatum]|nr:hypothetical protein BJ742DRAFT_786012 [Cladochytrium replicatum]
MGHHTSKTHSRASSVIQAFRTAPFLVLSGVVGVITKAIACALLVAWTSVDTLKALVTVLLRLAPNTSRRYRALRFTVLASEQCAVAIPITLALKVVSQGLGTFSLGRVVLAGLAVSASAMLKSLQTALAPFGEDGLPKRQPQPDDTDPFMIRYVQELVGLTPTEHISSVLAEGLLLRPLRTLVSHERVNHPTSARGAICALGITTTVRWDDYLPASAVEDPEAPNALVGHTLRHITARIGDARLQLNNFVNCTLRAYLDASYGEIKWDSVCDDSVGELFSEIILPLMSDFDELMKRLYDVKGQETAFVEGSAADIVAMFSRKYALFDICPKLPNAIHGFTTAFRRHIQSCDTSVLGYSVLALMTESSESLAANPPPCFGPRELRGCLEAVLKVNTNWELGQAIIEAIIVYTKLPTDPAQPESNSNAATPSPSVDLERFCQDLASFHKNNRLYTMAYVTLDGPALVGDALVDVIQQAYKVCEKHNTWAPPQAELDAALKPIFGRICFNLIGPAGGLVASGVVLFGGVGPVMIIAQFATFVTAWAARIIGGVAMGDEYWVRFIEECLDAHIRRGAVVQSQGPKAHAGVERFGDGHRSYASAGTGDAKIGLGPVDLRAVGPQVRAAAFAGGGNLGAEANATVFKLGVDTAGINAAIKLDASVEAKAGVGGVSFKVLGFGFQAGKYVGISTPFFELGFKVSA